MSPKPSRPSRAALIRTMIDVCRRLEERGYVAATDGNVSARLPGGTILITRTALPKGRATAKDFVEVTPHGEVVAGRGRASTELGMHLYIYSEREDVGAIVHAHPVCATGFAAAHVPLDAGLFPEAILSFGSIPLAVYATPSTGDVADSIRPFVRQSRAILLANHGVVTVGRDPDDAFQAMDKIEQIAQTSFVARVLGGGVPLAEEERRKLMALNHSGDPPGRRSLRTRHSR